MARLKSVGSRLGTMSPRLGAAPRNEAERSRQRDATHPSRGWYKLARWERIRQKFLKRYKWECQKTGVLLIGKRHAPNSPILDHIIPHRGDPGLFWDEDNLQLVSKAYHDSTKQSMERRGLV
ncbi:HNH endonuclease signature motif containing protein [Thalassobius sp. I31.1]|uniref:HNH endonuclease n=1 Tax=Thalassobius sp. I31.1 TaxID=2109912 RepID=UPI000D1BA7AD|nr:HNH endonuclease signature motif containing protein [Thalassobius sp. I31.1]